MSAIILDTNVLVAYWWQSRPRDLESASATDATSWARDLIAIHESNAILTPIYLEFVGGVMHGHEMDLSRAYLGQFRTIDEGNITAADWAEARRLAERIPKAQARPRGAIDCLIRAIAKRLRYDVRTADRGMPR